ncbi:aldose 1-epimerase [Rudanella lutea]|uniref:aldose 1-epimerase n=1 Tax=Rudanella lutea TaxID=451374 RepID=UPI00035EBE42|nr:hypothetical protein [Rudanella lutea]
MLFSIDTQPFGVLPTAETSEPILEYFVKYTETGEGFSVLPAYGGILRQLVLGPKSLLINVLRAPDSPQALFTDETYASALLYPFPSRIRHGIYRFEGEEYALPMNETARDNAIHGLVHPQPFEVIGQEITDQKAQLTIRYTNAEPIKGYPFPFSLTVSYILTPPPADQPNQSCTLTLDFSALNTGDTRCPASFGWHPYFSLNGEDTDALTIDMPVSELIHLDENLLPTGRSPFEDQGILALRDRNLDNAFRVVSKPEGVTTVLHSPRQQLSLHVWQDPAFPYLVVYTPGRRDHIAIEPLTANVNAFNNNEGLSVLEPGDALQGQIKVWVQ